MFKFNVQIMLIVIFLIFLLFKNVEVMFNNDISLKCFGTSYKNVTLTAYYPDYDDEDFEHAFMDTRGNKLMTLQDYIDGRNEYITLAMDDQLNIPYGTPVCIPELNEHYGHRLRFEVRDSSSNLNGEGFNRADVCVRSEIDSYDLNVNKKVTLVFESKS